MFIRNLSISIAEALNYCCCVELDGNKPIKFLSCNTRPHLDGFGPKLDSDQFCSGRCMWRRASNSDKAVEAIVFAAHCFVVAETKIFIHNACIQNPNLPFLMGFERVASDANFNMRTNDD